MECVFQPMAQVVCPEKIWVPISLNPLASLTFRQHTGLLQYMSCAIGWIMCTFLVSRNFCHSRCNCCCYGTLCGYLQTYFSSTNHLVWTNLIKEILSVLICFSYWQNNLFLHWIWIFIHSTHQLVIKPTICLLYAIHRKNK